MAPVVIDGRELPPSGYRCDGFGETTGHRGAVHRLTPSALVTLREAVTFRK